MGLRKEIRTDIAVVGAGVTGLMLTRKLSKLGYGVVLVDKSSTIASGPSTKNEGWLHRGTYHSTSIPDRSKALHVARRVIYGHDQIRSYAPESIRLGIDTYAVVGSDERAELAADRWEAAGVKFKPITRRAFADANPEVDSKRVREAFLVDDVSINTRLLYQKLVTSIKRAGARIILGTSVIPESDNIAMLIGSGNRRRKLKADIFIFTAGNGTAELYQQMMGEELPMRYWNSHLLVLPGLAGNNVFSLEPKEVAMFQHGRNSIIAQQEDVVPLSRPDFDEIPRVGEQVFNATIRLVPGAEKHRGEYLVVPCVKPEVVHGAGQARSLGIEVIRRGKAIFTLPGKMTEAPYVADLIAQMIFEEGDHGDVALRPTDRFTRRGR